MTEQHQRYHGDEGGDYAEGRLESKEAGYNRGRLEDFLDFFSVIKAEDMA